MPTAKPKKMNRTERKELERKIVGEFAGRDDVQDFMDRARREPHIGAVEVTARGMKVTFVGLPIKAATRLLRTMDEIRRKGSGGTMESVHFVEQ